MFPRRHDTGVLQLERNGSTIWAISPRNTGSSLLRILGATARQQCFCGRQLTNRNRINPAWMVMCKMRIDLRVVLPVISHQRPGELREIFRKPSQCIDFMCHTRSKPPILGRSPRSQQHRAQRKQVTGHKAGQSFCHVPRTSRNIEHRSTGMFFR